MTLKKEKELGMTRVEVPGFLLSVNPATGSEITRHKEDTDAEVEAKLSAAAGALATWRLLSVAERGKYLAAVARKIYDSSPRLSALLAQEMGKPVGQALREVERFAERCEYFGLHSEELLASERVETPGRVNWIQYEPLGVALGIMPWNYPFGQASRWAVPALMAGNVALLKHASNVTLCASAMVELFEAAGLPNGVLTLLRVNGRRLGPIISDDRVASISLTGSDAAGASVGELGGRHLKKMVLELGGSDPFIVLRDADIAAAATAAARARVQNSGQTCTAAKRFIVDESVADAFEGRLVAEFQQFLTGDPMDPSIDVGPLATRQGRSELERQVERSIEQGATVAYRARRVESDGFFFPPTVLVGVTPAMVVAQEETFGPVAPVIRVPDEQAALAVANSSVYGLGGSIWTCDVERGRDLAGQLEAGMVGINSLVTADPRLPFGGVKKSGFGREMAAHGIRELTNVKTVTVGA